MRYLKQFGIIISLAFMGEILNRLVPLPIPASVYGIILLFAGLKTGLIKLHWVKDISVFLIGIMPVMFIPAAAGLIEIWGSVKERLFAYLIIGVVATFTVMIVSGRVTQGIIRHSQKGEAQHD